MNRGDIINLIGEYGVECARDGSEYEKRVAAIRRVMEAVDADYRAGILAEREACAVIADELAKEADRRLEAMEQAGDDSAATEAAGRAESAATITDRIRARPAP